MSLEFEFASNSPVVPCRLSWQIFTSWHEAETSMSVNKHWKLKHVKDGTVVITNVMSTNQHDAQTFSM